MARKKNPDMKVVYIALAALGGLGAAYYFTRSKSGSSTSRLTNDAAAGNGGQLLLNNAPTSSYVPQSYTPTPAAGSGVVNRAAGGRPATPKEKQLGLNWLQALIQKSGTKSIYTPFSASDLATGSFGPKSRAALAIAERIMRAASAALPPAATKNFFADDMAGDGALQALVDVTHPDPTLAAAAPSAAEVQALVAAAGGTVGASIGAATPSPSAAPAASTSTGAQPEKPPFFLREDDGLARQIQRFCNAVASAVDDEITTGNTTGLRAGATINGRLTASDIRAYRKVLALYVDKKISTGSKFYPPSSIRESMTNPAQYTKIVALRDGYAARLNPTVMAWFNNNGLGTMDSDLASELEGAYDSLYYTNWADLRIPTLEMTEQEVRGQISGNTIVRG